MGDEHYDKAASDIMFEIRELPHPVFKRKNNMDLYTTLSISLEEALLGFEKSITHLDGHLINIEKDEVTQPGLREKFRGEGMPEHEYSSNFGVYQLFYPLYFKDLYVTYKITFPKDFTDE